MTANRFKERYGNHKKSFSDPKYENETELTKYLWKLKNAGKSHSIKWSILKQVPSYTAGEKRCSLCTQEKPCLLKMNNHKTSNQRYELFAKCGHAEKFHAGRFKSVRNHQARASAKIVDAGVASTNNGSETVT